MNFHQWWDGGFKLKLEPTKAGLLLYIFPFFLCLSVPISVCLSLACWQGSLIGSLTIYSFTFFQWTENHSSRAHTWRNFPFLLCHTSQQEHEVELNVYSGANLLLLLFFWCKKCKVATQLKSISRRARWNDISSFSLSDRGKPFYSSSFLVSQSSSKTFHGQSTFTNGFIRLFSPYRRS